MKTNITMLALAVPVALAAGCADMEKDVQAPTLTYSQELNSTGNGPVDCSLVLCALVECPEGFEMHTDRAQPQ
jgi:hypothetical protein